MNNVLFTKVSFFRNVKNFKFTPKLEKQKADEIVALIENAKLNLNKVDLTSVDEKVKTYFKENNLILGQYNLAFVDKKEQLSISLFNAEHLTISGTCYGYSKACYTKAKKLATALDNAISMSYSDKYGYLMSDLTKIGSGLQIECVVNLQAIKMLNKINQVQHNIKNLGYNLVSFNGDNFVLSSTCNLGLSEEQVLDGFEKTLIKLQELELESVKMLTSTNEDELIDKVERSHAILNSARLMRADELKAHLSNLILGNNLNTFKVEEEKINKLQKLVLFNNEPITTKQQMLELAKFTKEILKGENNA